MFGDIGKMMEAAQAVDFDKLSKLPDQIDRLIEAVEVGNMLTAMAITIGPVPQGGVTAAEVIATTRKMVREGRS